MSKAKFGDYSEVSSRSLWTIVLPVFPSTARSIAHGRLCDEFTNDIISLLEWDDKKAKK